ncbi:uncharacterized protein IAS62_005720 [Cryptococcus decagattii]|uniref:Conserved oligomeric Golgi complex subunit 6 n=1 Tax=Cryptococcus decagattii TaxID=1859122 RepID=A0ABZ2B0M6_9TREE
MATNPNTPAPPATRMNPISLRIYKAIGTSFDDVSSREALEIASGMYGPEDPKGKGKVQSEYEELEEDDDTLPKRRTLKGQSAATARKYLKQDIETSLATGSAKFLEAFAEVDQLDQASSGTKFLLERADVLRSQRASAQLRAHLITLFLSRFVLSNSELAALTSREVAIGQPLFDTLDHLEKIRTDCEVLLGGEEGKTQAGLDIMSVTSEQLELGYTKIHRYCQFEFRQFTRETQLEVTPVMRQAIHRLRDRPALLADAIQTLTSTRQSSILQQFLDALTRGGPGGLPRPIEIHAHDPTRYVGDMLAWVHQTTATEHEFLEGMFGVKEKGRWVGQAREGKEGEEERMASEVLDKNLEGLSRPLKLRIQQTIKSQEGIIMAYKIANLLQFYLVTMRKTIGEKAILVRTLQDRSLLRFLHPPDATLTPPITLRDAAHILRELLSVYSTSLIDPAERESDEDLAKLLDKAIGPCVEMCERMAEMRRGKSGGGEWERDIFMVNSLGYLEHTLEMFDFTTRMLHMLDEKIKTHVESMTFEHHGKLLEACGLAAVMRTIRTRPADSPLSRLDATSPKSLTSALSKFSTWLSTVDPSTSPRLALLTSSRLAEEIHRKVLRKIYEAYGEVCERVLDKAEGYEFGETMLRRGREEVGVALGVGEDWESEEDMEQRSTKKGQEQEGSAED